MAKNIDREQQAVYFVNIFARDNGTPPLNTSTTLEIVLDDGKKFFMFKYKLKHKVQNKTKINIVNI